VRSLGTASAPSRPQRAPNVHPVLDQMPAGAFDHAGGDQPVLGEPDVVAQIRLFRPQVTRCLLHPGPPRPGQLRAVRRLFEQTGDLVRLSFNHVMSEFTDPSLSLRVARGEEAPGRAPQVFEYVTPPRPKAGASRSAGLASRRTSPARRTLVAPTGSSGTPPTGVADRLVEPGLRSNPSERNSPGQPGSGFGAGALLMLRTIDVT
jgi:hypothetical protein